MALEEKSLGAVFRNRVEKYGDRTYLKVKGKGGYRDVSWKQVFRQVSGVAGGLLKMGIEPGHKVAILSENRPEWAYTDLGCLSIGAVDVPIYATNTPEQCSYIIKDSDSRLVFVSGGHQLAKLLAKRDELDDVQKVIVMDEWATYPYSDWVMGFREFVEEGLQNLDDNKLRQLTEAVEEDDLATFIYTSGTTGAPKGVMLTHGNFLANCRDIAELGFVDDTDIVLSFLPLSHSFERTAGYYTPTYIGATIAYAEDMDHLLNNIGEIRPTFMASVPRFYEKVYSTVKSGVEQSPPAKQKIFHWAVSVGEKVSKRKMYKKSIPPFLAAKYKIAEKLVFSKLQERMGGRLKFFVSGGAPLAKEIAEFFHAAGILILEGYGLTETSPVLTTNRPDDYRFGTVGKPLRSVEIRLSDGDKEILARGPNIMKGYYKLPDQTAEVLEDDGWFHTGDVGEWDPDGFLKVTDRLKDLIKTSGGKYVAPQHLEGLLIQDRFIEQVNVVGDKRKYCTALIVPNFDQLEQWAGEQGIQWKDRKELVSKQEVYDLIKKSVQNVNKNLPSYETIKDFRLLPEEFTQENNMLTPTMKVKRKVVNQVYADLIESMYPKE